jgi:hypothetical protein
MTHDLRNVWHRHAIVIAYCLLMVLVNGAAWLTR